MRKPERRRAPLESAACRLPVRADAKPPGCSGTPGACAPSDPAGVTCALSLPGYGTAAKSMSGYPANPALQPENRSAVLGQPVVTPPAAHVLSPRVPQLVTGSALDSATFPVPQELALPALPDPALAGIHLQPQMLLDPSLDRLQHPFRRRLTAYVDIGVVRIAAEPMFAPSQFSI
jgi:hypothetical protein